MYKPKENYAIQIFSVFYFDLKETLKKIRNKLTKTLKWTLGYFSKIQNLRAFLINGWNQTMNQINIHDSFKIMKLP